MTSNRPYLIRALHQWIIDNGMTPQLLIDATWDGVDVPRHIVKDDQVVLNVSLSATHGLDIGNEWIMLAARFNGASHQLTIPVAAVRAIFVRENDWRMLLPPEDQPDQPTPQPPPQPDPPSPAPDRSHLTVIK